MPQVGANNEPLHEVAPFGYTKSKWHRQPVVFGPTESLVGSVSTTSLPAGSSTLDFAAVPADTIWIVTSVSARYVGTVPGNIYVSVVSGAAAAVLFAQASPASNIIYDRQGWFVLFPGDVFRIGVNGATLNDDLAGWIAGYKMTLE